MAKDELTIKIGKAIREARKRRSKVMQDIATHLGINVAGVGNWERGENGPSSDNLRKTAEYLGLDPIALSRGEVRYLEDRPDLSEIEVVGDPGPFPSGPMDIKILGTGVGGKTGDFAFNGEIVGYARRPPGIANLNNVFAVHVIGDSMEPRFEPGDMIYCSTRTPVSGDDVVVELFPEDGERAGKAYIKRLLRREGDMLVCKQYNPLEEVSFNLYALKRVYRVIPLRELVGF